MFDVVLYALKALHQSSSPYGNLNTVTLSIGLLLSLLLHVQTNSILFSLPIVSFCLAVLKQANRRAPWFCVSKFNQINLRVNSWPFRIETNGERISVWLCHEEKGFSLVSVVVGEEVMSRSDFPLSYLFFPGFSFARFLQFFVNKLHFFSLAYQPASLTSNLKLPSAKQYLLPFI